MRLAKSAESTPRAILLLLLELDECGYQVKIKSTPSPPLLQPPLPSSRPQFPPPGVVPLSASLRSSLPPSVSLFDNTAWNFTFDPIDLYFHRRRLARDLLQYCSTVLQYYSITVPPRRFVAGVKFLSVTPFPQQPNQLLQQNYPLYLFRLLDSVALVQAAPKMYVAAECYNNTKSSIKSSIDSQLYDSSIIAQL